MKISIITTSYNAEKYIEETIESVLYQRGNFEIEYIIYDANSQDETWNIINKYKKLVDNNFFVGRNLGIEMKIFQENDNGMYDGIAKGLKQATGDIIAYINSDDYYMPNTFSCVSEIFDKHEKIKWIIGRENVYNYKGHNVHNELYTFARKKILKGIYGRTSYWIQQESVFWKKECLNDLDFEKLKTLKYAGDFYLWYTFAQKYSLYAVNSILSGFRIHDAQKSSNLDAYYKEFDNIVINNYSKLINNIENDKEYVLKYVDNEWIISEPLTKDKTHYCLNFLFFKIYIKKIFNKKLKTIKK